MTQRQMSAQPSFAVKYFDEPELAFANGGVHVDPKNGIARFGPKSWSDVRRHPSHVRVGFIGTAQTVELAQEWIAINSRGVPGDAAHPGFPGCMENRGFHTKLEFSDGWSELISRSELDEITHIRDKKAQFETCVELLSSKLALISRRDLAPEYVVLALPEALRAKCGTADYPLPTGGRVHRDLRRAFKAAAMTYRIPTQLLDQMTAEFRDPDNPSKIAWNFFTGLYFKAGGMPWGPVGLLPGTCYVGISFYRGLSASDPTLHTSLVQAFDEHGEGLVLRGPDFKWDADKHESPTPHLSAEDSFKLVNFVLDRYFAEMKQVPRRLVLHKSSRWWIDEAAGCREALKTRVGTYDLVALQGQDVVRLLPASTYPALRGTRFTLGELDYLYTTGFITQLGQFHGQHVPALIQISDHIGYDTPRETVVKEILILTKMNWNSSRLGGLFPITLRFSKLVSEIMREIPASSGTPLPQSKFYM